MIYTPADFNAAHEESMVRDLLSTYNFATLVTAGEAEPVISHLPFLYEPAADTASRGVLTGHLARANPQANQLVAGCRATVVFTGPHAYISPRWYEPATDNVPTWNYAVVHAHGTAQPVSDETAAYAWMQKMVHAHDPSWPLDLPERERKALLRGILVFQIVCERLDVKFKLSQNRSMNDRTGVVQGLESGNAGDQATARWMEKVF